jgi:hypothetical protein
MYLRSDQSFQMGLYIKSVYFEAYHLKISSMNFLSKNHEIFLYLGLNYYKFNLIYCANTVCLSRNFPTPLNTYTHNKTINPTK